MTTDVRGVPMTGADAFAIARYETALQQFQAYVGEPVATIDEALQAAPSFIAGHLLKADCATNSYVTEQQFVEVDES